MYKCWKKINKRNKYCQVPHCQKTKKERSCIWCSIQLIQLNLKKMESEACYRRKFACGRIDEKRLKLKE